MAQLQPAGIRALAISVPKKRRDITLPDGRTAVRFALEEGQTGLDMDMEVAREVLAAAEMEPGEVDLVISASFPALPEPCIGNGTQVAWALGMREAAVYNVESACAGGLIGLRSACQEVALGEYKNVLVIVGCPYAPTVEPDHPALDVIGDAAFAMLIGPTCEGQDFLGAAIRNSGSTCDYLSWGVSDKTPSGIRLNVTRKTAGQLEEWAQSQLPELCGRILERAGVDYDDIKHWVLNAPTPSFVDRTLVSMGARPEHGINTNRLLGNVGPALIGTSLFYSLHLRDFRPGDLVLCCSVGSKASLAVTLMQWPEGVALGRVPEHASVEVMRQYENERLAALAAA